MAKITVPCSQCGADVQRYPSQVRELNFCPRPSPCMGAYYRATRSGEQSPRWAGGKREVVCANCGKRKIVFPSRAKGLSFCDMRCKGEWQSRNSTGEANHHWRGGLKTVACAQCGTEKTVIGWVYDRNNQFFCGHTCKGLWQKANLAGASHPLWQGGRVEVVCDQCGNVAPRKRIPADAASATRHFCDSKCRGRWHSENLRGAQSTHWKGGVSPDRSNWCNAGGREWIAFCHKRDAYTCAICGDDCRSDAKQLHVHHKAGFTAYPGLQLEPANGVCVCSGCHYWLHSHEGDELRLRWEREALTELAHLLPVADPIAPEQDAG